MTEQQSDASTQIDRQVPVIVTITREHVVWIDVDADEDPIHVVESWREEPYDLLNGLGDNNAEDIDWRLDYEPDHHLLRHHGFGPTFPCGAFTQAEEDSYQEWERSRRSSASGDYRTSGGRP